MPGYRYRIVNVFAEAAYAGNPLAVFEDARGLDDAQMQMLTRQLNLSEATFVFPSETASAQVRIFTPGYELPFAGHPTLGTAVTLDRVRGLGGKVMLDLRAGLIPVVVDGDRATLTANAPTYRDAAPAAELASALGLPAAAIVGTPRFIDTGSEQLVVQLASPELVSAAAPDLPLFNALTFNKQNRACALVWAFDANDPGTIYARFFWVQHGQLGEDFGTGSACANLGGWLLGAGHAAPFAYTMIQGQDTGRLAHLRLSVGVDRAIKVGGRVVEVGRGEFDLE
ncbi:phenazine biosynthesis protein PhzF family [Andreprevotia lacus DSM 23236]|jgi:PhzF family phenazine biosynthesis protein|uniref:Phenazine biosynthesis protein PhzF family n=1 Tax=Andreprevotia lacus DSM 23236 TaxID=1121001 RepID=A0A1W1XXD5_9NEIS|nr:PhzF family phenazine biosynthesis protein [Andreprevotia lacus]SMC28532.1 phenazine biosynthesis protein PhzF family [Andreprevotia lacus DSM 23236]